MLSAAEIARLKSPLVVATAYDFPFARILEEAGVDIILVGDSLANVVLGLSSTREVNMEIMSLLAGAVLRGAPNTHITVDLPFGSDATPELSLINAKRLIDMGASSVKLEGVKFESIRALVAAGIPVMGHLGVLPQTATSFRKVGKDEKDREQLIHEALSIQEAGVFSMVLENVEEKTAHIISESISVPTIGIGSGSHTTGQVQVLHDLLNLSLKPPPFARSFGDLKMNAMEAIKAYIDTVRKGW